MNKEICEVNVNGAPEQETQESLEGLGGTEVRNLNNETQQSSLNDGERSGPWMRTTSETLLDVSAAESALVTQISGDAHKYWEHRAIPAVRNADNDSLGAVNGNGLIIGYVEDVNGAGAEEIRDFLPTRHELIQLAKYWAKVLIDVDYLYFCYQQSGSSEMRRRLFASRRVNRIANTIGVEPIKRAVSEAYAEYGKTQNARVWNIFLNGTPEQRKAVQEEIMEAIAAGENEEQSEVASEDRSTEGSQGAD